MTKLEKQQNKEANSNLNNKINCKNIEIKAVDFFCGAGGMTCGFRQAGIKVLAGIDINKACKETYEINNKGTSFIHADIQDLDVGQLSTLLGIKEQDDQMVFIGCSPCQYYSNMQTDKMKSSVSKMLLVHFQRFVDHYKPGYVVIENVPGFDSSEESPLRRFKQHLAAIGYSFDSGKINALQYNVPQNRKRYLLLATRLKSKISLPKPLRKTDHLIIRNFISQANGFSPISAGQVDSSDNLHIAANLSDINLQRIRKTPKNGGTRLSWKDDSSLQLNCYIGKDKTFPDIYGRMHWDKPSPTITTKFHSISNGRYGHPEEDRAISLREGAVLQTFPKNYRFISKHLSTISRMIGNAVPPELAKRIAKTITKHLLHGTIQN